jgi:hypothetical protein
MRVLLTGLVLLPILISCGVWDTAGPGTTSETENSIAGVLVDESGKPMAKAKVFLRSSGSVADTGLAGWVQTGTGDERTPDTLTDSEGRYTIVFTDTADYVLEYASGSLAGMARISADGRVHHRTDTLRTPVRIQGEVVLDSCSTICARTYVQVMGLDRITRADADGLFHLDGLPPAKHSFRVFPLSTRHRPDTLSASARTPGETVTLAKASIPVSDADLSLWSDSLLVTTATVENEPDTDPSARMVVLRGNDFPAGASDDGSDLRISDLSGNVYQMDIERWDQTGEKTEIWVLPSNDLTFSDSLLVLWGLDFTDPFPPALPWTDYAVVWHGGTTSIKGPSPVPLAGSTPTPGNLDNAVFGPATEGFAENSDRFEIAFATDDVQVLEVSLWFRADADTTHQGNMVEDSTYNFRISWDQGYIKWHLGFEDPYQGYAADFSGLKTVSEWHHAGYCVDYQKKHLIFVSDSVLHADSLINDTITLYHPRGGLLIGGTVDTIPGTDPYVGALDELRVRTPDSCSAETFFAEFRARSKKYLPR